ncbi:MAG: hypothetical protein Q7S83_02245 [bacterium]|nr:hypothetical protein [bacterium]
MKIWKTFKAGLIWSGVIAILVSFIIWALSLLSNFVISFSDAKIINLPLNLAVYALGILFIGWLIGKPKLRQFFLKLFSKIPLVSVVIDFFLNQDYIDKVTSGNVPEVIFDYAGQKAIGMVVNEAYLPNPGREAYEDYLLVIQPTTPFAPTGFLTLVRKKDALYTGRTFKDTMVTTASFGFNFRQPDQKNFKFGSPA